MSRKNASIIAVVIVLLLFIFLYNVDLIEFVTKKNIGIKIVFFIVFFIVTFLLIAPKIKKRIADRNFLKNMHSTEEFENIYSKLKENFERELLEQRKKMKIKVCIILGSSLIFVLLTFGLKNIIIQNANTDWISIINIILCVGAAVCGVLLAKDLKKYKLIYKSNVIKTLVKAINNTLEYAYKDVEKENRIKKYYYNSGFENERIDLFLSEDYITGKINESNIIVSDIYVQKNIEEKNNESTKCLFDGLFSVTNIKNDIGATIKVLNNKLKVIAEDDFVGVDSSELEKKFDVFSSDKMLVMKIFTPDTMNLLNEFYEKYKVEFEMILENNIVYMRFHTKNMFEVKVLEEPINKKRLLIYYNILKIVLEITEKINNTLNQADI